MKRVFIIFGLVATASLYGMAQRIDSGFSRKKLSKTDIQLVYSHYLQDGQHSAVTGGTGTEKLKVYSTDITINNQLDSLNKFSINTGLDIISSASTDNIDFIMSSASKVDGHGYLNLAYNRKKRLKPVVWGGSGYLSLESDYLSTGVGVNVQKTSKDLSRVIFAELEMFFDDMRWGRLNGNSKLKLVYPFELRSTEWFTKYRRRSFNLNTSFQQTINQKTLLAIFPGVSFQSGLLSTPFHRVYFSDSSLRVENLPGHRLRVPIGIQLNHFVGGRFIVRSYYRFYWDEWGVIANTLELELPVKLSPAIVLTPSIRMYNQTAARYFKASHKHHVSDEFYTSDYDLSAFTSYEPGIEMKYNLGAKRSTAVINGLSLKYSHYKRTDGLKANTISASIGFAYFKTRK